MAEVKASVMRQDLSLVNSRAYGAERTHVTIQEALDAIGSLYRTLYLCDEGDGIWTLGGNITIPANVLLAVPLGVTIVGTGNLTILGGLHTLRWPVYTGSGVFTWSGSGLTTGLNKIRTYNFIATNGTFDDLIVNNTLNVGEILSVPVPPDLPADPVTDWSTVLANQTTVGGVIASSGAARVVQQTSLTANTLTGSFNIGVTARSYLDLNGFNFVGDAIGVRAAPAVFGSGGTLSRLEGVSVQLHCMESSITTEAVGLVIDSFAPGTTGTVTGFTGIEINDTVASRVNNHIYGIHSLINIQGSETRYNLYLPGTAPNHLAGRVGIGAGSTDPKHVLHVFGRTTIGAPNSAPTDGDIEPNQVSIYINEAGNTLLFRVKYAAGTLKLGTVALT